MDVQSEAEARALDARCRSPTSTSSRTTVERLRKLPPDAQADCIARYARRDLPNLLRCCLAAGVKADTRWGVDGIPVLCLAAGYGSTRALNALLDGCANVALADKKGWTAAHCAAFKGHAHALQALLAACASKEIKTESGATPRSGATPLQLAAQEGHTECCSLLQTHNGAAEEPVLRQTVAAAGDNRRNSLLRVFHVPEGGGPRGAAGRSKCL